MFQYTHLGHEKIFNFLFASPQRNYDGPFCTTTAALLRFENYFENFPKCLTAILVGGRSRKMLYERVKKTKPSNTTSTSEK